MNNLFLSQVSEEQGARVEAATKPHETDLDAQEVLDRQYERMVQEFIDEGDEVEGDVGPDNGHAGGGDENKEEEAASLPEHACRYCGIHGVNSVVKCDTCDKWFCNSKATGVSSHIVAHLVRARHKAVSLHEDSDLGDTSLECYNCGNNNVFMLGFVSAKQESVVVILCRLPCAQSKDLNWDTNLWQALVDDRQFLPWVAAPPSEDELMESKLITHQQISKLEDSWRADKNATIEDIEEKAAEEDILPILMRYKDAFQYQNSFAPLVNIEAEYDRKLKESQHLEHIYIKWGVGVNNRHLASFVIATYESNGIKVLIGDEVILRYNRGNQEPWEAKGYIIRLPDKLQEEFTLELSPTSKPPPSHLTLGFIAEFVWKGTTFERMQHALKTFAVEQESVSSHIYHELLGYKVVPVEFDIKLPKHISHPKIGQLNASQTHAVKSVLQRPLSLIQGPPGTGKTYTSATVVYQLSKLNKEKVLVCAPSNVAVDHIAVKLDKLGLNVIRLTAKSREDVDSSVSHLALHNIVRKKCGKQLSKLFDLRDEEGSLSRANSQKLSEFVRKSEQQLLNNCDVLCCTCAGAGDRRLEGIKFRSVLIDESTQASEPEALIPIVKGAKQVILVGDHQQLGPIILDKKADNAGLRQSLFERLVILGHIPIRLEIQYRMHPSLSEFSSNMFYEGSLQNGVVKEQRTIKDAAFPWPVSDSPMMFWANYGKEEISGSGVSFLNRVEAMNVEKVVSKLFNDGVSPHQIGIITPYEGQRAYIVQYMTLNNSISGFKEKYLEVEVASVDAFQGREKDFIILSCVRANDPKSIGFLSDPRRLNVALTRAKYGLVILGNPNTLSKNPIWNHLLTHFREKGCLVEGPIDNLRLSMVELNNNRAQEGSSQRKFASGAFKDPETASVLSYAPDSTHRLTVDDKNWPALGNIDSSNNYNSKDTISTNYADRTSKTNNSTEFLPQSVEDEIKNVTGMFSSGFNLG